MAVESDGPMHGEGIVSVQVAEGSQPGDQVQGMSQPSGPVANAAGEMGNPANEALQELIAATDAADQMGPLVQEPAMNLVDGAVAEVAMPAERTTAAEQGSPERIASNESVASPESIGLTAKIVSNQTLWLPSPQGALAQGIEPGADSEMTEVTMNPEMVACNTAENKTAEEALRVSADQPAVDAGTAPLEAEMVRSAGLASDEAAAHAVELEQSIEPAMAMDEMDKPAEAMMAEKPSRRISIDWEERFSYAREFGMRAMRSALNVRQTFGAMSLMLRQTDVIFSGRASQGTGRARPEMTDGVMLVRLPADQMQQAGGVFSPAPPPQGALLATVGEPSTIIYFYDGCSSVAQSLAAVKQLRSLGCNVLCVDYLGYGMSSGQPSEKACYATAEAAFDYLSGREDIDKRHIIACGHRMGAAVAVELAVRRRLAGLMLVNPFTSMMDELRQKMPDLRMPILLKHRFDCESRLGNVQCPILMAHLPEASHAETDQPGMIQRLLMATHAPVCNLTLDMQPGDCAGVPMQLVQEARQFIADLPAADPQVNPQQRLTLLLPPKVPTKYRGPSTSGPRIREAC